MLILDETQPIHSQDLVAILRGYILYNIYDYSVAALDLFNTCTYIARYNHEIDAYNIW